MAYMSVNVKRENKRMNNNWNNWIKSIEIEKNCVIRGTFFSFDVDGVSVEVIFNNGEKIYLTESEYKFIREKN